MAAERGRMAGNYTLMGLERSNSEVKRVTKMSFDRTSNRLFIKAGARDNPILAPEASFGLLKEREGRGEEPLLLRCA